MDIKKRNKKLTEIEDILNSIKESLLILQAGLEMIAPKEKIVLNNNDIFKSITINIHNLKPYLISNLGEINMYLSITFQRLETLFIENETKSRNEFSKYDLESVSVSLEDVLKSLDVISNTVGYVRNDGEELDIPNFVNYDFRGLYEDIDIPVKPKRFFSTSSESVYLEKFKKLTEVLRRREKISKEDLKLYYRIKSEILKLGSNTANIKQLKSGLINLENNVSKIK